jgi:hypothetical protein
VRAFRLLVAAVIALPAAAASILAAGTTAPPDALGFQRLTGGLGLGPAVDLSRCAAEFDPRAGATCSFRHDPAVLASRFCPPHAMD